MRRRSIRLLLALGFSALVAGLIFGSARSSGTEQAAVAGSPDAPAIGAPVSAGAPTPSKLTGSATPVRIASLKNLRSQPVKVGRIPDTDVEEYPTRPGNASRDTVVQRTAPKNRMPSPIASFDGVTNLCGCSPPDTEGDVGPNHYMQWVNVRYAIYSKSGTQVVPPTHREHALHGHAVLRLTQQR